MHSSITVMGYLLNSTEPFRYYATGMKSNDNCVKSGGYGDAMNEKKYWIKTFLLAFLWSLLIVGLTVCLTGVPFFLVLRVRPFDPFGLIFLGLCAGALVWIWSRYVKRIICLIVSSPAICPFSFRSRTTCWFGSWRPTPRLSPSGPSRFPLSCFSSTIRTLPRPFPVCWSFCTAA